MKLTDRRLYQARNLEDLVFRYWFRDEDNQTRRGATREAVFYADKAFVSPDTNKIWGVDVSGRWDGKVDFKVTAEYGAKFEITKAVDGTIPTPYFAENNQSAYDAGLLNSAYAWLYPDNRINCTLQAQAFYNLVKDARLRLPPVVDFEWTRYAGIQANPNYEDLRKWLAAFIRLSGVKPILYTAAGYVDLFGPVPADILAMLSGVWVASYGGTKPSLPRGIDHWDMWQFAANGDALALAPGNQGKLELDLNYMTEDFYQRYAVTEPQEGTQMEQWKITWTEGARLRTGPAITFTGGSILPNGLVVNVLQVKNVSVSEAWAQHENGLWFATLYNSQPRAVLMSAPPADVPYIVKSIETVITLELDGVLYRATITDAPNVELVRVA